MFYVEVAGRSGQTLVRSIKELEGHSFVEPVQVTVCSQSFWTTSNRYQPISPTHWRRCTGRLIEEEVKHQVEVWVPKEGQKVVQKVVRWTSKEVLHPRLKDVKTM